MSKPTISTSIKNVRRLAVTKQRLAGRLPSRATREHILSVVRDLCYVQWDPIEAVAPSHIIALWSRIGNFRLSDLDALLWEEKKLFLHQAPAMIVVTEDYPLFYSLMRRYPESLSKSWGGWKERARKYLAKHELRKRILNELKDGPLRLNQFRDHVRTGRAADGWTSASDVSHMLFHLQMTGDVMIVGHQGNQNIWGLSEKFLPSWVEKKNLTEEDFEREAAQRALQALGTASPREIHVYFPRARYLNLKKTLERLQEESTIHRVHVTGLDGKDERYVHDKDIRLLESMNSDAWEPRMSLLPPFDNLVCERSRTNRIFGFDYLHENFLPESKRKFGTFVHPILYGDKLIGRADMHTDRKNEKLLINSIHAERGAPRGKEISSKIGQTIQRLAEFLGAKEVAYTARVPAAWRSSLR
ncbi:MAG TPA: crosslink repair DNA glycosylase YcaQ family protein [Candidatus Bathyarchaeia archaeon]|nr:crosslink repair DNA glycosylase YcaQ family protein [Candidatus Bathyarchaeia archaeon]